MISTQGLALRATLVAAVIGLSQATAAADDEAALAQIPAQAPIVLQIHGVARTRQRFKAMVKNVPQLAAQLDAKFDARLNAVLKGRKLQGLRRPARTLSSFPCCPRRGRKALPRSRTWPA